MKRSSLFALCVAAAAVYTVGCASNPATGGKNVVMGSMDGEKKTVQKHHQEIVKALGLYDDQATQEYVQIVGSRLALASDLPNEEFKFFVIDDEAINAFTTGCCNVYVNRGLLVNLNSEAELAGVLGHEIGHVTARHPARRQTQGMAASLGAMAAAILTGSNADGTLAAGFTCADWTSDSAAAKGWVGHSDGFGPGQSRAGALASWNSAHDNQNCSNTAPRGGAGRIYCFAR